MNFDEQEKFAIGDMQLKPDEFWGLTFYEYLEKVKAYNRKQSEHINELNYVAWCTAYWSRVQIEHFPKLSDVIQEYRDEQEKEQTPEEADAFLISIGTALGGTVVEV